ncbi:helix-turn-helix domain-containing protein [Clostridium sp.]|uniref:helix-turn-helix domain-containing protein n=1 Tax=Clostridium sp. TaxID=1506 RepID=UPI003A33594C
MLGDNIKSIREEKKLGLNETARLAGISPSYLSDIEKGNKTNPSMEVLQRIADALDVSIEEFFKSEPASQQQLKEWDDKYNLNGELAEQVKFIESLQLGTPEQALKFILSQPNFMAYGGYNLDDLSEEEIMDLANDMLLAMKLSIEKKRKKK